MTDKVTVGLGFKISQNFNSTDAHYSLSSDVNEGETVEEAFARVEELVVAELDRKFDELSN